MAFMIPKRAHWIPSGNIIAAIIGRVMIIVFDIRISSKNICNLRSECNQRKRKEKSNNCHNDNNHFEKLQDCFQSSLTPLKRFLMAPYKERLEY
ncbi:unnamed protein product [Moneuplotes crassus]|uniref:Uncharacterized protein n=1 Tax=Euplotes crassus TaxID=5936 RepID=A0AAD1UD12_EUPCR|nr:unnamed protein product [Moneuplotes crassus]